MEICNLRQEEMGESHKRNDREFAHLSPIISPPEPGHHGKYPDTKPNVTQMAIHVTE